VYRLTHGEPVAWGWDGAKQLGIVDIDKPDFGEPQSFDEGEVPVFWVSMPQSFSQACLT
jgi:uncharacterized protein YcsI (UPF0317 family)